MNDPKIEPQHASEGTDDDFFDDIRGKWAQMEAERRESDEFKVNNMEYDMSQADWFLSNTGVVVGVMLVAWCLTLEARAATTWNGIVRALVPRTTLSLWAKAQSQTKFVQIWHSWDGV